MDLIIIATNTMIVTDSDGQRLMIDSIIQLSNLQATCNVNAIISTTGKVVDDCQW